jgi:hypothetical protein
MNVRRVVTGHKADGQRRCRRRKTYRRHRHEKHGRVGNDPQLSKSRRQSLLIAFVLIDAAPVHAPGKKLEAIG